MKIRTKIFLFTLSVMIPVAIIVSYLGIDDVADKTICYLEKEMFSKKLEVFRVLQWIKSKYDDVIQGVSSQILDGYVPDVSKFEGLEVLRVYPLEGETGLSTDVKSALAESMEKGLEIFKIVNIDGKRYLISVVVSSSYINTIFGEIGKQIIISTPDRKVIFPLKFKGEILNIITIPRLGFIFKRLSEILDKYEIKLAEVNGEKLYLLPIEQSYFPNYIVYAVLRYQVAVDLIRKSMLGILALDSTVVLGVGILIFLYMQGLTKPIERIISQLTKKREERDYSGIDVETRSSDLDELVNMINDLLGEVSLHIEELENSYSKLEELHGEMMKTQEKIMSLNRVVNELMFIRDKKSVLDIASHELRNMFDEIEEVCYESVSENGSVKGGNCDLVENAIKVEMEVGAGKYIFTLLINNELSLDMKHIIELFLRMIATVAENKDLWGQVENSYFYLTRKLSEISEVYDDETGQHIKRVGEYCSIIARELGMDEEYIEKIGIFSQLHDIGKLRVPRSILTKSQPLTPEEFEEMKKHTIYGAEFIGEQPWLRMARNIALYHHENWDGTGYPFGLKGEEIPLEARIVRLADVYDALRSPRRYKPSVSHRETVKIILEGDGRTSPSHFDPKILEVFKRVHLKFNEIFEMWRD